MSGKSKKSATPVIRVGTSGFSYPEWKGSFYPDDLPQKKYLSFYAEHFPTTEINNTFYRLPTLKLTEGWHAEAPDSFVFTLKLSQKITHIKRLKDISKEMELFYAAADALEQKLGPILVQLPPNYKKNLEVLEAFLAAYSPGRMLAFEFRNDSWLDDEVYAVLKKYSASLGVIEAEEGKPGKTVKEATGSFVYMRLRKGEYSPQEMDEWASWIKSQNVDVYCYLKHDVNAPVLANMLLKALG